MKSLVWYVPDNFEDAGYEVPTTMEELKALTDQIVADGGTPWCIGLGSGGATGWPATDWVEDMMLRTQPPEVYDQWTTNEIPFNDPRVVAAIEEFGAFARNDDYVGGRGRRGRLDRLPRQPEGSLLLAAAVLHAPAGVVHPVVLPGGHGARRRRRLLLLPVLRRTRISATRCSGAGTLAFITKDTPAARAFIEFLETPIAHEVWMAQTGFLTPFKTVNTELYGDPTLKKQGDILLNATTFRFDGSDLMPAGSARAPSGPAWSTTPAASPRSRWPTRSRRAGTA